MLRDLREILLSPITIVGWMAASIVTALLGPFDTYTVLPLGERLLFWFGILSASISLATSLQIIIRKYFRPVGVLVYTSVTWLVFTILNLALVTVAINILYSHLELPSSLLLMAIISGVSATVFIMIHLISPETLTGDKIVEPKPAAATASKNTPQSVNETEPTLTVGQPQLRSDQLFLNRLGPDSGERLIRLAMRDHYIEVYTEAGQKMLHMRFADALEELAGLNGGQIHRSHWINFDEVETVVRDKGKVGFQMTDGEVVPIARGRKSGLKTRGLI